MKSKIFAGNNLNAAKMMEFVFDGEENFVGKGENAGYQHFFLFQQCFQNPHFPHFYAPASIDRGHIVFCQCSSVCLSAKAFTSAISFDCYKLRLSYFT